MGPVRENFSNGVRFSSMFAEIDECQLFLAKLWISSQDKISLALKNIKIELQKRLSELKKEKKEDTYKRLKKSLLYQLFELYLLYISSTDSTDIIIYNGHLF